MAKELGYKLLAVLCFSMIAVCMLNGLSIFIWFFVLCGAWYILPVKVQKWLMRKFSRAYDYLMWYRR